MNHRETRDGRQGGINRDFGARQYEDMPAINDRRWGDPRGRDDSFGPPPLGGYGDFSAGVGAGPDGGRREAGTAQRATGRRGKGPRNATRSDSLIAEELNERMTDDDQLDASEILLRVEDGHVLLTGEVPERWMKHRAEDIADGVRGVRDIENRIRVDTGIDSFGNGGPVRTGRDQQGSGFSSSPPSTGSSARDDRDE